MKLAKFSLTPPIVAISALFVSLCACGATQRYVSKDKSYGADIPNAVLYDKLQDAVAACTKGDTVWIDDDFVCSFESGYSVDETYGAATLFVNAESVTIRSKSGDWRENGPIVRGGLAMNGEQSVPVRCLLSLQKSTTLRGIRFENGRTAIVTSAAGWGGCVDLVKNGCRVWDCCAANGYANYGGGINGDDVVTHSCVVTNCEATGYGSGQRGGSSYDSLFVYNIGGGAWQYGKNASTIVSNCTFVGNSGAAGSAVSSGSANGTHTFFDCKFFNNQGASAGYAPVYGYGDFYHCVFSRNSAYYGGAVSSHYESKQKLVAFGSLKCYDCVFTNNISSSCLGSVAYQAVLNNCRVENNSGNPNGTLYGCNAYNTLIAGNTTLKNGSAVYAIGNNEYVNCTIVSNKAKQGSTVFVGTDAKLTLINTIVRGNSASVADTITVATNCCLEATAQVGSGEGNVTDDPKLVKAGKPNAYHLKPTSTLIGEGKVLDWMSDETDARSKDLAGLPRLTDGKVNIGCYEGIAPMPGLLLLLR